MTRKSFTLSALGFVLAAGMAAGTSAAQQAPQGVTPRDTTAGAEHRAHRGGRENMLFKGITLSPEQQKQVDTIRARHRDEMRTLRDSSGGDRQAMRGKMRDMMQRHMADIRGVLTPDQQKVFDQNAAQMREHMRDRGGRRGHRGQGADSTAHTDR